MLNLAKAPGQFIEREGTQGSFQTLKQRHSQMHMQINLNFKENLGHILIQLNREAKSRSPKKKNFLKKVLLRRNLRQ